MNTYTFQGNFIDKLQGLVSVAPYLPALSDLNMRHNVICRMKNYRLQLLRSFASIQQLDRVDVTEKERTEVSHQTTRVLSLDYIKKVTANAMPNTQGLALEQDGADDGKFVVFIGCF